ncbi:MAG: response regulator transcription factor [Coriobacteriales bacterium]|jgi:DNA-binding CsgD family transcriptional regulator|nr:response regulator transcription factor [Coriobacteriales bacterium]
MKRTPSELQADQRLADIILEKLDVIADSLIERHDRGFPNSSLSTLPREERLEWIALETTYLANSIRDGFPHARENSYRPSATAFSQTTSHVISDVVNRFDSSHEVEDVILPLLLDVCYDDISLFSELTNRLRHHVHSQAKCMVAASGRLLSQTEDLQREAMEAELRTAVISEMQNAVAPALSAIRLKTEQVQGRLCSHCLAEIRVSLSELKLLASDALEYILVPDVAHHKADSVQFPQSLQSQQNLQCQEQPKSQVTSNNQPLNKSHNQPQSDTEIHTTFTKRERDVLSLLAEGRSNAEIASALDLSELTVKGYVSNILAKTQMHNRTQLVAYMLARGSDLSDVR